MQKSDLIGGSGRHWRYISLAIALLLPLVACVVLTWMNAQRLSRTQAQTEAGIMRVQVERILREAWLGIDAWCHCYKWVAIKPGQFCRAR